MFVGGVAGTLLRAGLAELLPTSPGDWPWATFVANVAGCAILGYAIAHLGDEGGSSRRVALIGSGFCGALTTFSTLQLELYELVDRGDVVTAITYLAASLALGVVTVGLARDAVRRGRDLA